MPSMKDLLPYPVGPGWKEPTTSKEAAAKMQGKAQVMRERACAAIAAAGVEGITADEVAERIGESILAVRPRISELNKAERIEKAQGRHRNASGMMANRWRIKGGFQ